jgi:hypothetical protein
MKKAKATHKACSEDYEIWKTAEDGCKKLIRATVEEVYINELKDGTTFFHKVFVRDLLEHLLKHSTGLHAHDITALRSNMLLLYKNTVSIPDFILAMAIEEAQKKAKCAKLPILDIELAMYAISFVLQLSNYKKKMEKWEGCSAAMKTWVEWKQAYLVAYARGVNRKCTGATDKPSSQVVNLVTLPASHNVMDALAGLLDIWGNYCWTHRYKVLHSSKSCNLIGRKPGHNEAATVVDTKGGVDFNKEWYLQGNQAP